MKKSWYLICHHYGKEKYVAQKLNKSGIKYYFPDACYFVPKKNQKRKKKNN
ncbi:transcription termination/antitermination NusG family protein [Buttiauxella gaviniae]|uniref:transcription termination/antitermination NusG family protein n=1 Tax=Buttiauxella gaviniae TaxID=82990 RepID=UPI000A04D2AD